MARVLQVAKAPIDSMALTNYVFTNPCEFPESVRYVLVKNEFPFTLQRHPQVAPGQFATALFHRQLALLSLNETITVTPFDPFSQSMNTYMSNVHLQLHPARKGVEPNEYLDTQEMAKAFLTSFENQIFSKTQKVAFDYHGTVFVAVVMEVEVMDLLSLQRRDATGDIKIPGQRGILMNQTEIVFSKSPDSALRLKGAKSSNQTALIQPNFKFEDLGIGGLDKEFQAIFRRAFASRIFPPHVVEKLGIQHVKGILLFGPPGTGKTLMARQIGKMLNAREPLIVNGPEILNKFVGQSEENVRKLFAPAEAEYKQKGDESSLHIIIFDELDAICKQRGSKNDGTGVGDSIVNQLLAKMDGVDQLNNILIIGMTNRLDMIDEALLRPGRLEIHMEISLPDEKGRLQILNVHTNKMRQNNVLDDDVDLAELANLTKNFSGAEIAGLIKSATSFAFNRHVKVGSLATVSQDYENIKINRDDFMRALDEVHASFGVSETELKQCVSNGIIPFAPVIERLLNDGRLYVEQVKNSSRTPLVSLLLHGPPGSGKTALAASMAMNSDFPFIKLISPESMVGYSETAKMAQISKVFQDAYKSPLSVIVVDSLERLLDWVPIGPRFSNSVLQTLMVLLKKPPPKDKKLLVISTTTQKHMLEQMDLGDAFHAEMYVPNVSELGSVDVVLQEMKVFDSLQRRKVLEGLHSTGVGSKLSIGIKKLMMSVEMARQDEDGVDKLVTTLCEQHGLSGLRL